MLPRMSKISLVSLDNEYTFLRNDRKKTDPLSLFSQDLNLIKKLPSIKRKEEKIPKTTRNIERSLAKIKTLLKDSKQNEPLQNYRSHMVSSMQAPFPMQLPYPMMPYPMQNYSLGHLSPHQSPYYMNGFNPTNIGNSMGPMNQANLKQEQGLKNKKNIPLFDKKEKINRFRVCAYAVYFTIYIKYFSLKFTENRRNWFNERYAINDGQVIIDGSAKILKLFYEVDLYKMFLDAKRKTKETNIQALNEKQSAGKQDFFFNLVNFMKIFIDFMEELMTSQKFIDEHHEVFSVGVLNQSFMISNLYMPQEAALLHIHPSGYIQIGEETEVVMLMLKIIVKIIVYNFLLGLKFSRNWNLRQQKTYGLDESQIEQLWAVTRSAGVFLCIVCEQLYDTTSKNLTHPNNFDEMALKFNIQGAKLLQEHGTSEKTKQKKLDSKMILNLEGYEQMHAMISKNSFLRKNKQFLKLKLIDFLTSIHTCLKYEEQRIYSFVYQLTIEEEFLIFKGKKNQLNNKKLKGKNKRHREGSEGKSKDKDKGKKSESQKRRRAKANKGRKNKNSKGFNESSNIDPSQRSQYEDRSAQQNSYNSGSQESESDEDASSAVSTKRKRKMRFKVEQAFIDHKFEGERKLRKLKKKVGVLK